MSLKQDEKGSIYEPELRWDRVRSPKLIQGNLHEWGWKLTILL